MKNLVFIATILCLALNSLQAQSVNDELELQDFTRRFMAAYNAQEMCIRDSGEPAHEVPAYPGTRN